MAIVDRPMRLVVGLEDIADAGYLIRCPISELDHGDFDDLIIGRIEARRFKAEDDASLAGIAGSTDARRLEMLRLLVRIFSERDGIEFFEASENSGEGRAVSEVSEGTRERTTKSIGAEIQLIEEIKPKRFRILECAGNVRVAACGQLLTTATKMRGGVGASLTGG